ncbi:MAG: metalloprotease family protein [Prosthecobacter sp.]
MFIPGILVTIVTFPGVIVHETAHQLMCRLTGTPVLKVCYFQVANPAGYVMHDAPSSGWKHFLISVAPFLINTIVGLLIALPAGLVAAGKGEAGPLEVFLGWLGISVAMHAFPSVGDAASLWHAIKAKGAPWLLRIIGFPVVLIIFVGAALSVIWFDAIYAYLICFGLPSLLLESLV